MSMDLLTIHSFSHPDEGQIEAVDARDLHRVLRIGKDFSTWIKDQIIRAMLSENDDYRIERTVFPQNGENHQGGRPRIDYHLTLDAAKHVAMLAGTDEGRAVRQFLIDRDKKLRQIEQAQRFDLEAEIQAHKERAYAALPDFTNPIIAARAWADEVEGRRAAEAEIEASRPKIKFYDNFVGSDGLYGLQNAGRLLQFGPRQFCKWLVLNKYLHREGGVLVPYEEWKGRGIFITKTVMSEDGMRSFLQTFITPRGIAYFARALNVDIKVPQLVTSDQQYQTVPLHS